MNIVYVITGLSLGGAETITVCLANEMRRRGHHVAILYLTGENWFKDRIDRDIIVQSLGLSKNPFSLLKAQLKAKQFLKVFSPQVVHGNMVHANIFVRLLRLHCHIPLLISTEHIKYRRTAEDENISIYRFLVGHKYECFKGSYNLFYSGKSFRTK
ncbi:glycosyltransferase [Bacteroides fragilis]